MDDEGVRPPFDVGAAGRPRDQPLLPLPSASCASDPATLSIVIQTDLPIPQSPRESAERRYVRAVLSRYLWLPDTPSETSRHDRRLARTLYARGVPLIAVEAALLLATTRRVLREPWLAPLPRVRSIFYYVPVVAEILDNPRPPDLDYLTCLLRRLRPLAEVKRAQLRQQTQCETSEDQPQSWRARRSILLGDGRARSERAS